MGFRPLTGNYISQLSKLLQIFIRPLKVSVPLRGTTFLNNERVRDELRRYKFPSPYGELHFSIVHGGVIMIDVKVSVPLRGTTFLNNLMINDKKVKDLVSVPLRGTTFLNRNRSLQKPDGNSCFRPLTGNYISQCVG